MKILVAEDDPDISIMYHALLKGRGHNVILTKDGEECLIRYNDEFKKVRDTTDVREHTLPFDAVILDYRMPKMNGLEVAKEIISMNPHQRIIIASAYSSDIFDEAADFFRLPLEILQKPFPGTTLVNLLEDKRIYDKLTKLMVDIDPIKKAKLRHEQLKAIEDTLNKQGRDQEKQEDKTGG